ncbi:MAG: TrmB family transcriptional regulator [Thaumarchaeota archaeon]|nr:TrmB family transcriptional regulator [Nitrososphaerota archaeon]
MKEEFKLNSYESRIYIALLKRGMNSKEVSSAAGVPLPRVYDTLGRLSEKGFVERIGGVYEPIPPSIALESRISRLKVAFEDEHAHRGNAKKTLVELLQPSYERRLEKSQDPVLLKGLDSTGNRLLEILTTSKDIIFLVRKAIKVKEALKRYLELAPLGGKRVRLILPRQARLTKADLELTKKLGIEMAWYDNPILDMMVADDVDVMLGVPEPTNEEDPFSAIVVWIRNESFARSTREALEEVWNSSSKTP